MSPMTQGDPRTAVGTEAAPPDDGVVELCSRLVRIDTTNRGEGESEGERAAAEVIAEELSPLGPVLLESAPRRANVVVRVPGTDPTLPAVLVHAHLDVVPADPGAWTVPPFSGAVSDGYVWGRGSVDMKDMCAMTVCAVRSWAERGVRPRRDVVLAFVADEEATAAYGAAWLAREHASLFDGCAAAIGESGAFTFGTPGGPRLYPVGAAERGTLHLRLVAHGRAGHGSRPNPDNAVVTLVGALSRIAAHRWPLRLTPAVSAYLQGAADAHGLPVDLSSADSVDELVAALGRVGILAEATVRVSSTPTGLAAGGKVNVIPAAATALVDVRTLPGAEDETLATIDELIGPKVRREIISQRPAVSAPLDSPWLAAMTAALVAEDPDAVVVPYCLGGGTDAKSFSALGMQCYGFQPLLLPLDAAEYDYRAMAHGVDERVPVEALGFGARVLDRFLLTV